MAYITFTVACAAVFSLLCAHPVLTKVRQMGRITVLNSVSNSSDLQHSAIRNLIADPDDIVTSTHGPKENTTNYPELHYSSDDCIRHPKHMSLGPGSLGENVYVNVGHCSGKTEIVLKDSISSFPDGQEDKTKLYQQLRRSNTVSKESKCGAPEGHHSCAASHIRMERYSTFQGIKGVEVIDKCSCQAKARICQRHAYHITYFPESSFEKTVDIGACHGNCPGKGHRDRSLLSCRAVQNRSLAVLGPNGDTVVNVIEKCECTEHCYRVSHFEQVYDYTSSLENGSVVPVTKMIDVGQCLGGCNGHRHSKCVKKKTIYASTQPPQPVADDEDDYDYSDTESGTTTTTTQEPPTTRVECLMQLFSRPTRCSPHSVQPHRYRNRHGEDRLLLAITNCSCQ